MNIEVARILRSSAAPECPLCGAALDAVDVVVSEQIIPARHTHGEPLPYRTRPAVALACPGCEFCVEVK